MPREIEIKVRVSASEKFIEFLNMEAQFLGEQHQIDEYFTPPDRDFTATKPVNEWLRLRTASTPARNTPGVNRAIDTPGVKEAGYQSSINYKYWHRDAQEKSLYGDESESTVGDVAAVRDILMALKFRSLCTVDKVRKTWRLDVILDRKADESSADPDRGSMHSKTWIPDPASADPSRSGMTKHKKTETYDIALDREKTLGDFIEIELIGETTDDVAVVRDRMLQFLHDHGITDPNADQVGYPYLLLFG